MMSRAPSRRPSKSLGGGSKRRPSKKPPGDREEEVDPNVRRAQARVKESLTGTGLKDFVFHAAPLIQDTRDNLSPEFPALTYVCAAVMRAALTLDDDNWERFIELPTARQHTSDYEVHTAFFNKVEPTWKALLTTPKTSETTCCWLHVGTEAPSIPLGDLLDKMGWFGVNIGPNPPAPHLRDKIEHIALDPFKDADDVFYKDLTGKKGGLVPKPKFFKLVFVNLLFTPDDPILDSSDEEETADVPSMHNKPPLSVSAPADSNQPKKKFHELSTEASGYGKIGVTRGNHVRRRLRALRNVLSVGLARLENEGVLIITWPALPFHPMLFFLTKYLRGLFMRVHLLTPDGIKTWEVYILCAKFKRGNTDEPGEGGGSELKSFLDGAYRANCLDDVLLWTLTAEGEINEARGQKGSQGVGYEDLWKVYGGKLESLANDLSTEVIPAAVVPSMKKKKGEAKAKAKAEAGKKDEKATAKRGSKRRQGSKTESVGAQRRPKSRGSKSPRPTSSPNSRPQSRSPSKRLPAATGGRSGQAAGVAGPSAASKPQTSAAPKTAEGTEAQPEEVKPEETVEQKMARLQKANENWRVMESTEVNKFIPQEKPPRLMPISRSYPSLSCSLGAAPGMTYEGYPDRQALIEKYQLLAHALDCTEHNSRRWHRRRLAFDPSNAEPPSPPSPRTFQKEKIAMGLSADLVAGTAGKRLPQATGTQAMLSPALFRRAPPPPAWLRQAPTSPSTRHLSPNLQEL